MLLRHKLGSFCCVPCDLARDLSGLCMSFALVLIQLRSVDVRTMLIQFNLFILRRMGPCKVLHNMLLVQERWGALLWHITTQTLLDTNGNGSSAAQPHKVVCCRLRTSRNVIPAQILIWH